MLTASTDRLIEIACNADSSQEALQQAAQTFLSSAASASRDDANQALRTISEHFRHSDPMRASFLALICGALIERGCAPESIATPLIERLSELLTASASLAKAALGQLPDPQSKDAPRSLNAQDHENDDDHDSDAGEAGGDRIPLLAQAVESLETKMPEQFAAWRGLEQFWCPAIALFSLSPNARSSARHLRGLANEIAEIHEAGYWLSSMFQVLEDEPILVIEPSSSKGILARISGVVDNFQLNVLLMDGFPKPSFLSSRRVAKRVAEVARGNGPQRTDDYVTGAWNLYTWPAIQKGRTLPAPSDYSSSAHWVWNEGTPEDIPVFEGRRAILLGPPAYPRTWQSQRIFAQLPAALTIEKQLTKGEAADWLDRMLAAK